MSCPSCLNLLRFPVNLGCGHSMCKVCILNGDELEKSRFLRGQPSSTGPSLALSSRMGGGGANHNNSGHSMNVSTASATSLSKNAVQITCRICHATSTFTSEAALVVDKDLQAMVEVLQGTSVASEACMRCQRVEASTSCTECNAKMCDECCDLVHVGALRNHQIMTHSSGSLDPALQPRPCDQHGHGHYRKELFCVDCGTFLCVLCAQQLATHKTHNVVTAAEAAVVERKRLVECVHAAETFRSELRATVGQIDAVADATLHHAREEIQVFEDTINGLIDTLVRRRDELVAQAKSLCDAEVGGLRDSRDRIFSLATRLNESVAEGNKALRHKSAVAIVMRSREMEDAIKRWDPIVVPSASCPAFSFPHYKDVVSMLSRIAVQPAAITSIEAGLDANHLGKTLQIMNERTGGIGSAITSSSSSGRARGDVAVAAAGLVGLGIGAGRVNATTSSFASNTFAKLTNSTAHLMPASASNITAVPSATAATATAPPLPMGKPPLPHTASATSSGLRPAPPPPPSNARSLLGEFNEGATSPQRQQPQRAIAGNSNSNPHFLTLGGVGGHVGGLGAAVDNDAAAQLVNSALVMRSPRTNLTDPSGGVLIEPTAMLPSRQHAAQFKFVKSTFGGLQFLNNGRTAVCMGPQRGGGGGATDSSGYQREALSWETAMCDTLLAKGRHYYELHLDRYTAANGHNVLIGLVFDGNFGLCDAIGEDNNSVGLDLGAGTKCIGGNYSLPYTRPDMFREGDVVGVDVNFDKQTLEFYHNGKYLGVAFTGLNRPCYPAVSMMDAQQVTLMFPMQRPL